MAARKTSKAKPNHNKEFFEALRLMEEGKGNTARVYSG